MLIRTGLTDQMVLVNVQLELAGGVDHRGLTGRAVSCFRSTGYGRRLPGKRVGRR